MLRRDCPLKLTDHSNRSERKPASSSEIVRSKALVVTTKPTPRVMIGSATQRFTATPPMVHQAVPAPSTEVASTPMTTPSESDRMGISGGDNRVSAWSEAFEVEEYM